MTKQRALAVLTLLLLVTSLSLDLPAFQGKSKGKGKSEKSEGSDKKSGKSEDYSGSEKGRGKSDSDEDDGAAPPLFKGKLGVRGSSQSKDQATLGFNGVEPNGSLQEAMRKVTPSADDEKKADQVSALAVKPESLDAFIRRGKLNPELPQKKDKKEKDKKDAK